MCVSPRRIDLSAAVRDRPGRGSGGADPGQSERPVLRRPGRRAVLLLGDTAWPLFVKYGKNQAEAYLKNRSAKGFTVIQGVLASSRGRAPNPAVPAPIPAGTSRGSTTTRPGPTTRSSATWTTSSSSRASRAWSWRSCRRGAITSTTRRSSTFRTPACTGAGWGRGIAGRPTSCGSTAATASRRASRTSGASWRSGCARATAERI